MVPMLDMILLRFYPDIYDASHVFLSLPYRLKIFRIEDSRVWPRGYPGSTMLKILMCG